ncbi:hypothetical protein [Arthrobacter methylotrophus]|uniref:Uncharacterized protein n=1 Tax=Arthrobacter methylotrophus TaxID=121291 RepID=A0ABV5URI6_9MICC
MTKNVENRARVQAGIKTGGQFAPEAHSEPAGLTLTMEPSPLDRTAVGILGALVRARSATEMGAWQRRQDKGRYGYEHEPRDPVPEVLVELDRRAAAFETLPKQEQEELLDQLKMQGHKYLLEPGQRLGNDKVQVAADLDTSGNTGLALVAQRVVADTGIPGTITLAEAGDLTKFTVRDGDIKHTISVGPRSLSLSTRSGEEDDYSRDDWFSRADVSSVGGYVFDEKRAEYLRRLYESHREYTIMMDVVAGSSFRDSEDHLGQLDRSVRSAELRVDGVGYLLDVSGDEPALKTDDGQTLHPSMVRGFLNHTATLTGHPDGDAFASDLREVFRETDRRLVR